MKKVTLLGLQMMTVFSSFGMDMGAARYNFCSDDCPQSLKLFGGEIDNFFSIDQEKLAFLVRNNNKQTKGHSRNDISRERQKQSLIITRASFQNIIKTFNKSITEDNFDRVCSMLEEHQELQEDCVLAVKLMNVRLSIITSVEDFYKGLAVIPVNAAKMAQRFATIGNNQRFLQSLACHQNRTAVLDI